MYSALFVIYAVFAVVVAASPIPVRDCGVLDSAHATYQLANDIKISNRSYGFVCFNIKGNGITLDGNGFEVSSASEEQLHAVGVQYSGTGATVKNLRLANLRTGIHANGKFGKVHDNTITRAVSGIDVTATHNEISNNLIKDFDTLESASGIYVYFPAIVPIDSSISITNNVISDLGGDSFVQGVSVYYATSVNIANNQIFNLHGISNEEISIINGEAKLVDNKFEAVEESAIPSATTTLLFSAVVLVASFLYFRSSSSSMPAPAHISVSSLKKTKKDRKEVESLALSSSEIKKKEMEAYERDDERPAPFKRSVVSFHIGTSPAMG